MAHAHMTGRAGFLNYIGMHEVGTLYLTFLGLLDEVTDRDTFIRLVSALRTYGVRLHIWTEHFFPWHLGAHMLQQTQTGVDSLQAEVQTGPVATRPLPNQLRGQTMTQTLLMQMAEPVGRSSNRPAGRSRTGALRRDLEVASLRDDPEPRVDHRRDDVRHLSRHDARPGKRHALHRHGRRACFFGSSSQNFGLIYGGVNEPEGHPVWGRVRQEDWPELQRVGMIAWTNLTRPYGDGNGPGMLTKRPIPVSLLGLSSPYWTASGLRFSAVR